MSDSGKHDRRCEVGERADEGHGKLADSLVGFFLALGVGVCKEAANGEQHDGANAKPELGRHEEARRFAHDDCKRQDQKEPEAARPAVLAR